uniref:Origin recognition complex subunit 3 N-terminal domain-containing protein n=1 Tax=Onchocerca volvulus TaxID=6282 RepID=A0A8R1Y0D2_ONCVO
MEYCTFHKGKRKLLESEPVNGHKNNTFLNNFNVKCSKLIFQIDCELNKLYEEVVFEVATFTKSYWENTLRSSGIPVAVVRCETLDGYDFETALVNMLKIKPICISPSQTMSLYDLHEMLRKMDNKKYIMLKQVECFTAGPYLDGLISVLSDPVWEKKIVLVVTVAVDFNVIFTRFSQESFWKLTLYCFHMPTPTYALQAVCEAVAIKPDNYMIIDGTLHKELRERFLRDSLSVCELKRILKVMLLHKMLECEDFGSDIVINTENTETETALASYDTFLYLLQELTTGFPCHAENVYELHTWIQSNPNFFTEKGGPYSTWKSIWVTWSVEEMVDSLLKLWNPIRRITNCYSNEVQKLLVDLREIDQRKTVLQKEALAEHEATVVGIYKKRLSLHEMQQRMRDKIAQKKRLDVVSQDRQRFVRVLTQIMSKTLRIFHKVPSLEGKLLVGQQDVMNLVVPSTATNLEKAFLQPKLHNEHSDGIQMDLCLAYRSLLDLSLECKNIPIYRWLTKFQEYVMDLNDISPVLRLYRCIGELEFMGILKSASERNRNKVMDSLSEDSDDYSILGDALRDASCNKNDEVNFDACKEDINQSYIQTVAFYNLIKYSLLMFTLPFIAMYCFYLFIKDRVGWTASSALIPAALVAVLVVYLIIAIFVYVAYKEETNDAEMQEILKKQE